MLVDNTRADAIKRDIEQRDNGKLIWQAVDDLLTDRRVLLTLLAAEYNMTEKQAADALGVDRLEFRRHRAHALVEATKMFELVQQ